MVIEASKRLFGSYNFNINKWSYTRLSAGLIIHEALGFGILVTVWLACYRKRPFNFLIRFAPDYMQKYYEKGLVWSEKKCRRFPNFCNKYVDPHRFFISGAESYAIRKVISPITIPTKLYLAAAFSGFFD